MFMMWEVSDEIDPFVSMLLAINIYSLQLKTLGDQTQLLKAMLQSILYVLFYLIF